MDRGSRRFGRVATMGRLNAALLGGCLCLAVALTSAEGQTDRVSLLVGKWQGDIQTARGTFERVLIINSIEGGARRRMADASYGGTGAEYSGQATGIAPVEVMVDVFQGNVSLRFYTQEGGSVELTLNKDGTRLTGSLHLAMGGKGAGWGDNPITLSKVL